MVPLALGPEVCPSHKAHLTPFLFMVYTISLNPYNDVSFCS